MSPQNLFLAPVVDDLLAGQCMVPCATVSVQAGFVRPVTSILHKFGGNVDAM
jgi:hypothetical protein